MTTDTQTPPERCPVCGAGIAPDKWTRYYGHTLHEYICRAEWLDTGEWIGACRHAMTAALRCHATLEPTPLEAARQALVDAVMAEYQAVKAGGGYVIEKADEGTARAIQDRVKAVAQYAALLEPAP